MQQKVLGLTPLNNKQITVFLRRGTNAITNFNKFNKNIQQNTYSLTIAMKVQLTTQTAFFELEEQQQCLPAAGMLFYAHSGI